MLLLVYIFAGLCNIVASSTFAAIFVHLFALFSMCHSAPPLGTMCTVCVRNPACRRAAVVSAAVVLILLLLLLLLCVFKDSILFFPFFFLLSCWPEVVYYSWVMFTTRRPAVWMRARAIHHSWEGFRLSHTCRCWDSASVQVEGCGCGSDERYRSSLITISNMWRCTSNYEEKKSMNPAKSRAVQGERWD